jgi:hypothetical protein
MSKKTRKVLLWVAVVFLGLAALERLPSIYMTSMGLFQGAVEPDDIAYFQMKLAISVCLLATYALGAVFLYRRLRLSQ